MDTALCRRPWLGARLRCHAVQHAGRRRRRLSRSSRRRRAASRTRSAGGRRAAGFRSAHRVREAARRRRDERLRRRRRLPTCCAAWHLSGCPQVRPPAERPLHHDDPFPSQPFPPRRDRPVERRGRLPNDGAEAGADAGTGDSAGGRRAGLSPAARVAVGASHRAAALSVVAGTGAPFALSATTTIVVPAGNLEVQRIGEQLAMIMRTSTAFANPITQSDARGAGRRDRAAARRAGVARQGGI